MAFASDETAFTRTPDIVAAWAFWEVPTFLSTGATFHHISEELGLFLHRG